MSTHKYKIEPDETTGLIYVHTTFPVSEYELYDFNALKGVNASQLRGKYEIEVNPGKLFDPNDVLAAISEWGDRKVSIWDHKEIQKAAEMLKLNDDGFLF